MAQKTGVGEREIRNWFDEALITAQGFRAQALEGPGANGDEVLRELEDAHLIRADPRRGARWYELAHDRLVAPIRASNIAWRAEHLNTLQREAQVWDHQSRPHGLLMTGKVLAEAEEWASAHDDELSDARPRLPRRVPGRGSNEPQPSGGPRSATVGWRSWRAPSGSSPSSG